MHNPQPILDHLHHHLYDWIGASQGKHLLTDESGKILTTHKTIRGPIPIWSEFAPEIKMSKAKALTFPYIQLNTKLKTVIGIDVDRDDAETHWKATEAPEPNLVLLNRENGHGMYLYALQDPVFDAPKYQNNLKFFKNVTKILTHKQGGDTAYNNHLMKNPWHNRWEVFCPTVTPYRLHDLYQDYSNNIVPDVQGSIQYTGRNDIVFNSLRIWAYENNCHIPDDEDFFNELTHQANKLNNQFDIPMESSRVYHIVKQIHKFCIKHHTYNWGKRHPVYNEGIMQLDKSIPYKQRQAMGAQYTHAIRVLKRDNTINKIINELLDTDEKITQSSVSLKSGYSLRTIKSIWQSIIDECNSMLQTRYPDSLDSRDSKLSNSNFSNSNSIDSNSIDSKPSNSKPSNSKHNSLSHSLSYSSIIKKKFSSVTINKYFSSLLSPPSRGYTPISILHPISNKNKQKSKWYEYNARRRAYKLNQITQISIDEGKPRHPDWYYAIDPNDYEPVVESPVYSQPNCSIKSSTTQEFKLNSAISQIITHGEELTIETMVKRTEYKPVTIKRLWNYIMQQYPILKPKYSPLNRILEVIKKQSHNN